MRPSITDRYEKNHDGRLIIDVTVAKIEELYNSFDSAASYKKKDLDEEFADYLIDCVREIKQHDFLLRINLEYPETQEKMDRVRGSIRHYFKYRQERQRRKINKHLGRSGYLFGLGITLVFLALSMGNRYEAMGNILTDIGVEGLTIVAWVSMWEAASNLIFEWVPHFHRFKQYGRISASEVLFRYPQQ